MLLNKLSPLLTLKEALSETDYQDKETAYYRILQKSSSVLTGPRRCQKQSLKRTGGQMSQEVMEAVRIIQRSRKLNKPFGEHSQWDKLDPMSKSIALSLFDEPKKIAIEKCYLCGYYKPLTGWFSHVFGVDPCCEDCSDALNPRYMKNLKEYQRA